MLNTCRLPALPLVYTLTHLQQSNAAKAKMQGGAAPTNPGDPASRHNLAPNTARQPRSIVSPCKAPALPSGQYTAAITHAHTLHSHPPASPTSFHSSRQPRKAQLLLYLPLSLQLLVQRVALLRTSTRQCLPGSCQLALLWLAQCHV